MNTNVIKEINQTLESLSSVELNQVLSYVKAFHESKNQSTVKSQNATKGRSEDAVLEKDKQPDQT
ncbi:MAG TPA: hypothetical protein VIZ65_14365 [Cellvibrionaceae bacterium]